MVSSHYFLSFFPAHYLKGCNKSFHCGPLEIGHPKEYQNCPPPHHPRPKHYQEEKIQDKSLPHITVRFLFLSCFAVIHAASSAFSPDILNNINARLKTTALLALTCNSIDVTVSPFHFPDRSSLMVFHSQNRKKYSKILRKILLIKYHVQFLHCDYFEP